MNKFISLKQQGNISDNFACMLLEQALCPELLHEVLLTNCDLSGWDDFSKLEETWRDYASQGVDLPQATITQQEAHTFQPQEHNMVLVHQ